jgi:hypothetical protein
MHRYHFDNCKFSPTHKGSNTSEETKIKLSKVNKGRIKSIETRKKLSDSHKGKKHTEETIKKYKNKPKKTCLHCNKIIDVCNYKRWHGDNCRFKNKIKTK